MNEPPLEPAMEKAIRQALLATWSDQTQPAFWDAVPSYNQCAQTSIVVCERFGGEILRTKVSLTDGSEIDHFYNRIGGKRYDFTEEQFVIEDFVKPIIYLDVPSNRQEAEETLQPSQLFAMRNAFSSALSNANAG